MTPANLGIKVYFNKFAESAAVVIAQCFCIAERLEYRVRWKVERACTMFVYDTHSNILCSIDVRSPAAR